MTYYLKVPVQRNTYCNGLMIKKLSDQTPHKFRFFISFCYPKLMNLQIQNRKKYD